METLLTNNIFFAYLLGVLVIINYEAFEKKQKIAIIYACSFGLTFNSSLRCMIILLLLLFILFLYEEYLNEDLIKIRYVTELKYKLLDYIYMYVFQYKIQYVLVAIILKSNASHELFLGILKKDNILKISLENILLIFSILILILGVHKIFNNPVELNNFKKINQKFSEYPYYALPVKDKDKKDILFEKLELVADVEDYTFFQRKNSYSSFSVEFIRAVMNKKKKNEVEPTLKKSCLMYTVLNKIIQNCTLKKFILLIKTRKKISRIRRFVALQYRKLHVALNEWKIKLLQRVKKYVRGYSTIEMQLIRILAYQKGLYMGRPRKIKDVYLVVTRKIYEIIYAPMFFSGLKKYLGVSIEKDFFRYYIVYIYLHTVQTTLNGKKFAPLDKVFCGVDVIDWPMEALFIIVLGLSNRRITKDRVDLYMNIILKYKLNKKLIYQLVECID